MTERRYTTTDELVNCFVDNLSEIFDRLTQYTPMGYIEREENLFMSMQNRRPLAGAPAIIIVFLFAALTPVAVAAQSFGAPGGGGYGMMSGGGMMGWGPGQTGRELDISQATKYIQETAASAQIDKTHNRVSFSGARVFIAMAAVQPGFPDTTFEVGGLVDPTIEIPAGAQVTLLLINMDFGPNMDHGVVITDAAPPYPAVSMMGMGGAMVGVPVLQPRTLDDKKAATYEASSVTFRAPDTKANLYYLCQYRDHASKGMYGRLEIR